MRLEIGDNLVHLLQLGIIATVAVLLALYTKVDVTTLLVAAFGTSGVLSAIHLNNIAASNAANAASAPIVEIPAAPSGQSVPQRADTEVTQQVPVVKIPIGSI